MKKYKIGIDIGTASLGLVVLDENNQIAHMDTIVYGEPIDPKTFELFNQSTRAYRLQRRQLINYKDRIKQLHHLYNLSNPQEKLEVKDGSNIFELRAKAINEKITFKDLFRVILHMAKNRGYKGDLRKGEVKKEIEKTEKLLENAKVQTLGQYYYIAQQNAKLMLDKFKQIGKVASTGTFIKRESIEHEFDLIIKEQSKHHEILNKQYLEIGGILDKKFHGRLHNKINTYADAIKQCFFYQRPVKWDVDTIGNCELTGEKVVNKTALIYQEYRIEKKLADLRLNNNMPLNPQKKDVIRSLLNQNKELSYQEIYKALNLTEGTIFTEDKGSDGKGLFGNKTLAFFNKNKNAVFESLTQNEKEIFLLYWSLLSNVDEIYENKEDIKQKIHQIIKPTEQEFENVYNMILSCQNWTAFDLTSSLKTELDQGRAEYSKKALEVLIQGLKNGQIEQDIIEENKKTGVFKQINFIPYKLASLNSFGIKNPIVLRSLKQLENSVKYAMKKLDIGEGKNQIKNISVEVTREMKTPPSKRKDLESQNNELASLRKKYAAELAAINLPVNDRNVLKYLLWKEQDEKCAYTGNQISTGMFYSCEIDHIIPTAKGGSNKLYNKVLVLGSINNQKTNMTPYQAYQNGIAIKWEEVKKHAKKLQEKSKTYGKKGKTKDDSHKKAELLTFEGNPEDIEKDMTRAYNETSYIGKFLIDWLKPITNQKTEDGEKHNINATRGVLTAYLRKHWGLDDLLQEIRMEENKPLINEYKELIDPYLQKEYEILKQTAKKEELNQLKANFLKTHNLKDENALKFYKRCDHRHHLIDATVIAFTDRGLINSAMYLHSKYHSLYKNNIEKLEKFKKEIIEIGKKINIRNQLKEKLINFVVWTKPDRHISMSFFDEGVYALNKDNRLIKKEELASFGKTSAEVNTYAKNIVGNDIKQSILNQFNHRYHTIKDYNAKAEKNDQEKEETITRWALIGYNEAEEERFNKLTQNHFKKEENGIFFPEHNKKNKVKKVRYFHNVAYNKDHHLYKLNNNSVRIKQKDKYSCLFLDEGQNGLLTNYQAFIRQKEIKNREDVLFKNDLVFLKSVKKFFITTGFKDNQGILFKQNTEPFSFGDVYQSGINTQLIKTLKSNNIVEEQKNYLANLKEESKFFMIVSWKNINDVIKVKDKKHLAQLKKEYNV
jgi:CRISPR-associated endonuclease Csn1